MLKDRSITYYDGGVIEVGVHVTASRNEFTRLLPSRTLQIVQNVLEEGARRGRRRFERGKMNADECLDHALQHFDLHIAGDTSEDHLAHCLTRLFMAVAIEREHIDPDDMHIPVED